MGRIDVEIMPWISEAFGSKEKLAMKEEVVDGELLIKLLNRLSSKYNAFSKVIFDRKAQKIRGDILVLINGLAIPSNRLETKLQNGDKVTFIPPAIGGQPLCISRCKKSISSSRRQNGSN